MNIAVFIDGDNIPSTDVKNIIDEIRGHGRIITANVYGDWSQYNMTNWMSVASSNGITCVQCDRLTGKNSTDIKLMLDMLKMLYTNNTVEIFFVVTSDSDYRHVVSEIKLMGKQCFCLGSAKTNSSLQNICDKFVKIENLKKVKDEPTSPNKTTTLSNNDYNIMLRDILRLLSEHEAVCMSKIKAEWTKKYQFDHREYGHQTFSSFLFHHYGSKLSKIEIGNGSNKVKLKT